MYLNAYGDRLSLTILLISIIYHSGNWNLIALITLSQVIDNSVAQSQAYGKVFNQTW